MEMGVIFLHWSTVVRLLTLTHARVLARDTGVSSEYCTLAPLNKLAGTRTAKQWY